MIIYEVNIRALAEIAPEFESWLEEHISAVLETEGFLSAEWYVVKEDLQANRIEGALRRAMRLDESIPMKIRQAAAEPAETHHYCVQYRISDQKAYEEYLRDESAKNRQQGLSKFGSKFVASRRVLEVRRSFDTTKV